MIASDSVPLMEAATLDSLYNHTDGPRLFDARSRQEYNVSHLPGALWIGEGDTIPPPQNHEDSLPVVVYCSVGYRSGLAGERLLGSGYKKVYNLDGGIFHWTNSGRRLINNQNEQTDSIHGYSPVWGAWLDKGVVVYE